MGRPRHHGEETRDALLDAAEQVVEEQGLPGLSVRRLAEEAGTTTRAVYSLFGSRGGLVAALGSKAFDWLARQLDAMPLTDDPEEDLVRAGATAFRRLVVEHPALFQVGVQQTGVGSDLAVGFRLSAENAMTRLTARIERVLPAGGVQGVSVREAAFQFHALCEGLAALELRGSLCPGDPETLWRNALGTLVDGLRAPGGRPMISDGERRSRRPARLRS